MPVVGEAIIRVRVTSDQLGNDIRNAVRDGFHGAGNDADNQGAGLGRRFSDGMNRGVRNDETRRADEIDRSMERSTRAAGNRVEGRGSLIGRLFSRGVGSGMRDGGNDLEREGAIAGRRLGDGVDREVRRGTSRTSLLSSFRGLGSDIGKNFNIGLGAARMGPAVIGALAAVGPSLLSGVGAIVTSLAAEIITTIAAIGPGVVGALGVAAAGFSTLGLNLGLLKLAFSGTSAQAKAFKAEMATFKDTLTAAFAPGVLSGFSDMIGSLKTNLLPAVKDLLAQTGVAMGDVARQIGKVVTSSENLTRIRSILTTNIGFLGNFKDGLSGLVSAFLTLFAAAKPFVDYIGTGIKRFGEWAAASLSVSEANGNLSRWMQSSLDSFKGLLKVVVDFGKGIGNVFSAAAPAGASLLTSLAGIADRFRAWTSDSGNMARMTAFFEKAHTLSSKIFELFGAIFKAGGNAFSGMDLGPILHTLDVLKNTVAPAIARIFNQIQTAVGPKMVQVFDNIGTTFTKIADSGVIGAVAGALANLFVVISNFFATDFGAKIAALGLAFLLFGGPIKALIAPVFAVGKALLGLSGTAGVIAASFTAVVGVFILAYTQSQSLRDSISGLWTTLSTQLQPVIDAIVPSVQGLWNAILNLGKAIGDVLAPIISNVLAPVLVQMGTAIGGVVLAVTTGLTLLADVLTGLLSGNWQPLLDDLNKLGDSISTWWNSFTTAFSTNWDTFWNTTLPGFWDNFSGNFGTDWNNFWTRDIPNGWDTFTNTFSGVWDTFWNTTLPNLMHSFTTDVSKTWDILLGTTIPGAWGKFTGGFSTAWDLFWNTSMPNMFDKQDGWITRLGNKIYGETLPNVASTALDKLKFVFDHFWQDILPNAFDAGKTFLSDKVSTFYGETLPNLLNPLGDKINGKMSDMWSAVTTFLDQKDSEFGTAWTTFWQETVPNFVSGMSGKITTKLDELPGAISTWFEGLKTTFGTNWQSWWDTTLPEQIAGFNTGIQTHLDSVVPDFNAWVANLPTAIGTAWNDFWSTTLPTSIDGLWGGVSPKLDSFNTDVSGFFDGIWTTISTSWTNFWGTTLPDTVGGLWPGVDPHVSEFWTSVTTWWDGFVTDLGAKWDTFWGTSLPDFMQNLVVKGQDPMDGFTNAVSGWWDRFTGWLSGLWDTFWGTTLPDIIGKLTDAGLIKVDAFKTSIAQKFQDVWNECVKKVNGMIEDVKTALTNWSFPDISAILHSNLVKPFIDTLDSITRLVGQITGASAVLNTAKGALDAAQNALAAAQGKVGGTAIIAGGAAPRVVGGSGVFGLLSPLREMLQNLATVQATPFALGGVVNRPTLALLGEAGRERVDPIMANGLTGRDMALIRAMVGEFAGASQSTGAGPVNVYLSGERIGQFVEKIVDRRETDLARRVKNARPR